MAIVDPSSETTRSDTAWEPWSPCDLSGELTLTGRLLTASNASFVATVAAPDGEIQVIYKPIKGERELWDFPPETLALREVAAYRISAAGGFDVVPFTTLVEGPFGQGSAQIWVADDEDAEDVVDLVPPDAIEDGWLPVMYGENERSELVAVVHADDPRLRKLAVFDALINNADRKAGHILRAGGEVFGCDHGISFHSDDKLRTLLWGWAGEPLTEPERSGVTAAVAAVDEIADLISDDEITALIQRADRLLEAGLPHPRPDGPAVPWPLW